uniref:hypothetical protein n=2 Tax=Pseudomonas aeruginosa TaxID=287 RepID=UPI0006683722
MLKTQNNLLDYLKKLAQVIEKARTAEVEINGEPAQIQAFAQAVAERELLVPVVGAFSAGKSWRRQKLSATPDLSGTV